MRLIIVALRPYILCNHALQMEDVYCRQIHGVELYASITEQMLFVFFARAQTYTHTPVLKCNSKSVIVELTCPKKARGWPPGRWRFYSSGAARGPCRIVGLFPTRQAKDDAFVLPYFVGMPVEVPPSPKSSWNAEGYTMYLLLFFFKWSYKILSQMKQPKSVRDSEVNNQNSRPF